MSECQSSILKDSDKMHARAHLQLRGRDVDARNELGDRVLHLQARVQLQKVVLVIVRVQILDRADARVADLFGEAHGGELHLPPNVRRRGEHRTLLRGGNDDDDENDKDAERGQMSKGKVLWRMSILRFVFSTTEIQIHNSFEH
jgi:hypothetical protein